MKELKQIGEKYNDQQFIENKESQNDHHLNKFKIMKQMNSLVNNSHFNPQLYDTTKSLSVQDRKAINMIKHKPKNKSINRNAFV